MSPVEIGAQLRRDAFLWFPVLLGCGNWIYFSLAREPVLPVLMTSSVCCWLALVLFRRTILLPGVLFVAATLLLGVSLACWRSEQVAAPVLGWHYYGPVTGTVIRIDRSGSDKPRLWLNAVTLDRVELDKTPAIVRVTLSGEDERKIRIGEQISLTARLSPPPGPTEPGGFDFRRYAWFERIGAIGYTTRPFIRTGVSPERSLGVLVGELRQVIAGHLRHAIPGEAGDVAAAILVGDRSGIEQETLAQLRRSNLAHLLAISGLHMGLMTGLVFFSIRAVIAANMRLALYTAPNKVAAVSGLIAGAAYLLLSGASVATERAFIMAAVVFLGILLGRRAISLRSVALAATIILLIWPESLTHAGFQMSFAATTALVAGFEQLNRWPFWQARHILGWLRPVLVVIFTSALAGFATAPFAAFHFNQFSNFGLIANVMSVPVMGMIVMPALLAASLMEVLGIAEPAYWLAAVGIEWILFIADKVGAVENAVTPVKAAIPLVLPMISLGACMIIKLPVRSIGVALVLCGALVWAVSPRPELLISDDGGLFGLRGDEGRAMSKPSGHGFVAKNWLQRDGDGVSQAEASERAFSRDIFRIPGHRFSGSLDDICLQQDVVIAPKLDFTSSECLWVGPERLSDGAMAIDWIEGEPRIVTARGRAGNRPWTDQE